MSGEKTLVIKELITVTALECPQPPVGLEKDSLLELRVSVGGYVHAQEACVHLAVSMRLHVSVGGCVCSPVHACTHAWMR